jgi:hypothetical protein
MAVVAGTVVDVWGYTAPFGPVNTSTGTQVLGCFISATFTGTYAQADDASITSLTTTISTRMHSGKTVVLLDACGAAPGDEAGTAIGAMGTSVSGSTLTCTLTDGTLAAEHANAALGSFNRGVCFFVMYTVTQP